MIAEALFFSAVLFTIGVVGVPREVQRLTDGANRFVQMLNIEHGMLPPARIGGPG